MKNDLANLKVGDVAYIIIAKNLAIEPVQVMKKTTTESMKDSELVVEEHVMVRTLDSEDLYKVGSNDQVYKALLDAKSALIDKATKSIEKMCERAEKRTSELLSGVNEDEVQRSSPQQVPPTDLSADEEMYVELPDGTKAKVNMKFNSVGV